MPMIVLLGEHDKGTGTPFHPSTVSGRRLRNLVSEIGIDCQFDNAYLWDTKYNHVWWKDLRYLKGNIVVALGRVSELACKKQNIECVYLPHPACRSKAQLQSLREGLLRLPTPREPDRGDSPALNHLSAPEVLSAIGHEQTPAPCG